MDLLPFNAALKAAADFLNVRRKSILLVFESQTAEFNRAVAEHGKADVKKFCSTAISHKLYEGKTNKGAIDLYNTFEMLSQSKCDLRIEFYLEHENANLGNACIIDSGKAAKFGTLIYVDSGLPGNADTCEKVRVVKHYAIKYEPNSRQYVSLSASHSPPPARIAARK